MNAPTCTAETMGERCPCCAAWIKYQRTAESAIEDTYFRLLCDLRDEIETALEGDGHGSGPRDPGGYWSRTLERWLRLLQEHGIA